jgi:drug/metabolite transporter (DMT)-like permease
VPRDSHDQLTPAPEAAPRVAGTVAGTLGPTEWGLIALQAIFWGSTFFFIAIARKQFPPLTLSVIRLVPAAMLLLAVITAMGLRLPATRPQWERLLIFSALNNAIPFSLIILAQREVTGGIAAIFMAMGPLWALLLAPLLVAEERFTWQRLSGILVGILGVAVITGASGSAGTGSAQVLLVLATVCFACANIYARKFLGGLHPFVIACCQILGSLVLTVPLMLAFEKPFALPMPESHAWLAVIAMGFVGSGLAPLCHFTVLRRAGPVNSMLASIVVPITPVVLGALFLGEHLSLREIFGGLIIACGLLIIDGRPLRSLLQRWQHNRPPSRSP